jgi:ankyrin repeat protein
MTKLAKLYNIDPSSPRRVICDKLVEILKSKVISLPNGMILTLERSHIADDDLPVKGIKRLKDSSVKDDSLPDVVISALKRSHIADDDLPVKGVKRSKDSTIEDAVIQGILVRVKNLVKKGVDLKVHGPELLKLAIINQHLPIVKYLVSEGVDIYSKDINEEEFLLNVAINRGNLDIIKYLVEQDQNKTSRDEREWLVSIAKTKDVLNFLLDKWSDIKLNKVLVQMYDKDIDFLDIMLKRGADINYYSGYGKAILAAIDENSEEHLRFFIENGADLNDRRAFPRGLPLLREIENLNLDFVILLMENGAIVTRDILNYALEKPDADDIVDYIKDTMIEQYFTINETKIERMQRGPEIPDSQETPESPDSSIYVDSPRLESSDEAAFAYVNY